MTRNEELFARAQRSIPGGVNSPVRAFRSVGGTPRFFTRGEGAYLWDADGKRYLDYVGSWGPAILGTCARRHRARGAGGGALRLVVRGADRSRGRARRNAVRPVALARPGAARELGYRGDDERAAPRARLYRSGQDRQVRGLLSRPRRQPAGQGRLGRAHFRPALVGRRPGGDRRRDDRALVQRPRGRGRGIRRAPRRHRLHHRRAGRGQHEPDPAGAGVSSRACGSCAIATARC